VIRGDRAGGNVGGMVGLVGEHTEHLAGPRTVRSTASRPFGVDQHTAEPAAGSVNDEADVAADKLQRSMRDTASATGGVIVTVGYCTDWGHGGWDEAASAGSAGFAARGALDPNRPDRWPIGSFSPGVTKRTLRGVRRPWVAAGVVEVRREGGAGSAGPGVDRGHPSPDWSPS
jgi:hypothetical protein